jgi:pimeloyl-ACP methyl ester carboxylesterase
MQIVETKTSEGIKYKGLLSVSREHSDKIIIHIHGMGGSIIYNNFYALMHEKYSQNAYSFLVGELRGSEVIKAFERGNESVLLGNAFERFEDCVEDIQAWVNFAVKKGYKEIWLQAHSLGPSKVAYYLSQKNSTNVEGVIWLSPSDIIGLVHYPKMINKHNELMKEAKELINRGKGNQLLSDKLWGEYLLSAKTYVNFFEVPASTAIFNSGNNSLGWKIINNISVPVLAITGTQDDGIEPVIDPEKAMVILKSKLKNSPRVKTLVYEGAEHSFNGFEEQIVNDVLDFINKN